MAITINQTKDGYMGAEYALALLAQVLAKKSPNDFAAWAGCSLDEATAIFAAAVASAVLFDDGTNDLTEDNEA